ncbi:MAG: CotH kinase family protein [Candidatus Izemoplasmatales bacterium]|jgi:spore coat protein CotH|nr:CotH kinase family protein [Candidatus Izemoplasmatales bacterium]
MRYLWLKRVILMFLLVATIASLSYYQFIYAENSEVSIENLIVNRKQKTDYKNLFNNSNFKTLTIAFTDDSFNGLLTSMQSYFELYGTYQDNTLHKVTLKYSDGLGNAFEVLEVGFRTKSNTTRNLPLTYDWMNRASYHQTSFQLQFNATFDYSENSNEYTVLKQREVFNLDQLNFEYCKSFDGEYDEAMISEAFSYYLYDKAGVTVSNASYGIVYFQIGDTLVGFGFYTIIEPVDQEFLKKNYKSDAIGDYGDLYKATDTSGEATLSTDYDGIIGINQNELNIRYSYALKNNTIDGTRQNHNILIDFINDINDIDYFASHVVELIDVDQFLRALAIGYLLGNTDDYRYNYNNYYLYFNVYTGKAEFIPFDLDNTLGFGKHQDLTGNYGVYYDLFSPTDNNAILVKQIFAIDIYRNQYISYLNEFVENYFTYDLFYTQYSIAKELYQDVLVNENHLGNQVFGLRNVAWYFTVKTRTVLENISNLS